MGRPDQALPRVRGPHRDHRDDKGELYTDCNGRLSRLNNVYIRGSSIRFMVVPDMLREAPMFKRLDPKNKSQAMGVGRGMKEIIQAQMGLVRRRTNTGRGWGGR